MFGFTGEPTDPNNLVYLRNRHYNPMLGAFMALDPLEGDMARTMSLNRYGYVEANVTNSIDPSGQVATWVEQVNSGCRPATDEICPWGGIAHGEECSYSYNPKAAAAYAKKYSAQVNSLFCTFNYAGVNNCHAGENSTNCANFVSQALLYGGLPMNEAWFCAGRPCGGENGTNYDRNSNWTGAYGLSLYLGITLDGKSVALSEIDRTNTKIPQHEWPKGWSTHPQWEEKKAKLKAAGKAFENRGLGTGDIIYLGNADSTGRPGGEAAHVVMIVGWGPIIDTWEKILTQPPLDDFRKEPEYVVPYVVDNSGQGKYGLQFAKPRPYYALWWRVPGSGPAGFAENTEMHEANEDVRVFQVPKHKRFYSGDVARRAPSFTKTQLLVGS